MGVQEEIFEEFFKKLREDRDFPEITAEELKKLWENNEIASQEKILNAIKRGIEGGSED